MATPAPLSRYWSKRDFSKTSEPRGEQKRSAGALSFVIQKHHASHLHYDFRLELDGVLVSWAVPKGPSFDPADKRLAVHVEDHPLSYGTFEGTIPPKQYGAGKVIVWDNGSWQPEGDPHQGIRRGKLVFTLHGQKLAGKWELVKIAKGGERQEPWLLFKKRDEFARPRAEYDVVTALPDSVIARPVTAKTAAKPATQVTKASPKPRKTVLPATFSPQLATLAAAPPTSGEWIYELKFDGYRILARVDKGKVRLLSRNGHDWTAKLPQLAKELAQLKIRSSWLDGEIVVPGVDGAPDFNALQNAVGTHAGAERIQYFLFDAPFLDGVDLRDAPLTERRAKLQALLESGATEHLMFSAAFEADAAAVLQAACSMHFEGVIAKRADSPYVSRRSDTWLKLKCSQRQEFVIAGYLERSDDKSQIGSLLLGIHDDAGALVSVGKVGTGWDADEARKLKLKLHKLEAKSSPFAKPPPKGGRWARDTGETHWVKPTLIAEVRFGEWTPDNQIRHASYVALRSDKPAKNIAREVASAPPQPAKPKAKPKAGAQDTKVTHGERVIDPASKLTKLHLFRYYEAIAPWLLPHLKGRPCSLVRGPAGVTGQLFFQKHADKGFAGAKKLPASLWPEHAPLLEIDNAKALLGAAQMNVIEFHTWNSQTKNIDQPDRMIFDLDPGEGTAWTDVQEAATLTRAMLSELGLEAWLKTSGGKGLHVVVPLAPRWDFDTVKGFAKAVVQHLAKTIPARFVAKSGASNRVGRIFVDYLRNGHGATTAAAFSARARAGLGVSMPVAWEMLPDLTSGAHWTITNAIGHLSGQKQDPWAGYWKQRQSLVQPMKRLSFKP